MIGRNFSRASQKHLKQARIALHYAIHLPMRAGKMILPKQADFSHTALLYNTDKNAFQTADLDGEGLTVGVVCETLTLEVQDKEGIAEFALAPATRAQATTWLKNALEARGFDTQNFDKGANFDMPPSKIAEGTTFGDCDKNALNALGIWFHNAHIILAQIREQYVGSAVKVSEVYCWPHHFDLACLISFDAGDPETARSVGVGISPGDDFFNGPYFYCNPYPTHDAMAFPELPAPAFWNRDGFISALTKSEDILSQNLSGEMLLDCLTDTVAATAKSIGVEANR